MKGNVQGSIKKWNLLLCAIHGELSVSLERTVSGEYHFIPTDDGNDGDDGGGGGGGGSSSVIVRNWLHEVCSSCYELQVDSSMECNTALSKC